jgi:hypothetical protein
VIRVCFTNSKFLDRNHYVQFSCFRATSAVALAAGPVGLACGFALTHVENPCLELAALLDVSWKRRPPGKEGKGMYEIKIETEEERTDDLQTRHLFFFQLGIITPIGEL